MQSLDSALAYLTSRARANEAIQVKAPLLALLKGQGEGEVAGSQLLARRNVMQGPARMQNWDGGLSEWKGLILHTISITRHYVIIWREFLCTKFLHTCEVVMPVKGVSCEVTAMYIMRELPRNDVNPPSGAK